VLKKLRQSNTDTDLGTREYASIICSDVAWKSSSGPVVPAAMDCGEHRCNYVSSTHTPSRFTAALTLCRKRMRQESAA